MENLVTIKKFLQKIGRALSNICLRKHLWQIHFFGETIAYIPFRKMVSFIFRNNLQEGRYIQEYEQKFQKIISSNGFAFSFGSGRMALYAILNALNIGPGDEVILPAFTCEVIGYCLLYRAIKPVYADIQPQTFNLDISQLESKITPKTKAIIVQHTFGIACETEKILELSQKYNFFVIEDCALSLGSQYQNQPIGSLGHAAFFSTDWTKIISTQWGGMAFTRNPLLAQKLERIYLTTPFLKKLQIFSIYFHILISYLLLNPYFYSFGKYLLILGFKSRILFNHRDNKQKFQLPSFYPYRLSNFQSYIGLLQLEALPLNLVLRKEMVEKYCLILKNNSIQLPSAFQELTLRFPLLVKDRTSFKKKWKKYFEVGQWFDSPLTGRYVNLEECGYKIGSCPMAEKIHQHVINFPTHQKSKRMREALYKIMSHLKKDDLFLMEEI